MSNTNWYKWSDRNKIVNKSQPAVYFIAYSENVISGNAFTMLKEIIYIGMTISVKGLKSRLEQFEKSMKGGEGIHGGAERVRFKHKDFNKFLNNVYVSARIFHLSATKNTSSDWRIKGACIGHEYISFADYIDLYHELPEFNDHNRSKKK